MDADRERIEPSLELHIAAGWRAAVLRAGERAFGAGSPAVEALEGLSNGVREAKAVKDRRHGSERLCVRSESALESTGPEWRSGEQTLH